MSNWKQQREEKERAEAEFKREQEEQKKLKLKEIVQEADHSGKRQHDLEHQKIIEKTKTS